MMKRYRFDKKCIKCGQEKEIEFFYKNKKALDGHSGSCKECDKKHAREYSKTEAGKKTERRRNQKEKRKQKLKDRFKVATK